MEIKCTNCEHTETTDKDFFVKLIGGAMPVGGFWAWTTYLFAGTGFAMAIVVAIIGGGVAMLIFKDEIVEWIINKDYKCSKCGEVEWKAVTKEETISATKELGGATKDFTDGATDSSSTKKELEGTLANMSGTSILEILEKNAAASGEKLSKITIDFFSDVKK